MRQVGAPCRDAQFRCPLRRLPPVHVAPLRLVLLSDAWADAPSESRSENNRGEKQKCEPMWWGRRAIEKGLSGSLPQVGPTAPAKVGSRVEPSAQFALPLA